MRADNLKKKILNQGGLSRNYFNIIRKNTNYELPTDMHLKNESFFREPIYQKRKIEKIKDKRAPISSNNSPNNLLKNKNNLDPKYNRNSFHKNKKLPLNKQSDSNLRLSSFENNYNSKLIKHRLGANYNNKVHIDINDSNERLNANSRMTYNIDRPLLNEAIDIKQYINHEVKREINKLKYKEEEEDINLVKEQYNKLKKEYDDLNKAHLILKDEYNKIKNLNIKLNYEKFEIGKNLDEMYDSQALTDPYDNNYDILCLRIDILENENKELKNKLKDKSSFLKNEKITHFELRFISEITKKSDNNIKIRQYHTPNKYNKKENQYNKLIEINNIENFKKLKDNYNDLNQKYNYLKNEFVKITNEFNNIKKQENNNNINFEKSFCLLNQEPENIAEVCNFSFKDTNQFSNQNDEHNNLLEKKIINSNSSKSYVNSIIQCLVNVNKLFAYFLNDFPEKSHKLKLKKNKNIKVLNAFHSLIEDINQNKDKFSYSNSVSLNNFKEVISIYNSKLFDLNCENFLSNLLKIFHEELNYLDNKIIFNSKSCNNFNDFNKNYNMNNSSITIIKI